MVADFPSPPEEYIQLGRVGKAHGLRGEVKITCFSEQPENVAEYKRFYLMTPQGEISKGLSLIKSRVQGKGAIVQFEAINSRQQAETLLGATILIAKSELPEITENKFYYYQFHGKRVVTLEGCNLGIVKKIFDNGAQDILVVETGQDEIFIPVIKTILVKETEEELIVDLPPGLLELNKQSV